MQPYVERGEEIDSRCILKCPSAAYQPTAASLGAGPGEPSLTLCSSRNHYMSSSGSTLPSFSFSPASSFLKQALEGEYPKLLQLYNELWRRLQQYSTSLQGALPSSGGMDTSLDITATDADSQDLFTHGKQDYK